MKRHLQYIVLALAAIICASLLVGCADGNPQYKPTETEAADAKVTAGRILEIDGIVVYRFVDEGRSHYFAVKASDLSAFSTWQESCGKNCHRTVTEEIATVRK